MAKIIHPYGELAGGQWLRGNLHTHTTASDGRHSIQKVIDAYSSMGYDFLMISDHDVYTTAGDYEKVDGKGMILVPGNEISAGGVHLLHVDPNQRIEPFADRQKVIDDVNRTQGFIIVNHPNWQRRFDHCSMENLAKWEGYTGLEIYNGVIGVLEGSPYATNKWDQLLSVGRRVWGYANDDCHWMENDIGLGWNMVYVDRPSVQSVVESLRHGRFYASTGVVITGIEVNGKKIVIETENALRIVGLCDSGKRFAQVDDRRMEIDWPEGGSYVRFECWGCGEQFAWTQPMFMEGN